MGTSLLQPSFAAGELSPSLYSRTDLARYQIGLKTCRNFIIRAQGGASNRPGTKFVDYTMNAAPAKLIRFKFSIADACVLVMGSGIMRVVRNGAYIMAGASPYSIPIPWTDLELEQLNYTQSGDIMTFVHTSHRPRELKRFANDNWTLTEPQYVPSLAAPAGVTVTFNVGTGATKLIKYQVTAVQDDTSDIEESLPGTSNSGTMYASDQVGYLSWGAVAGATYYNVYKDQAQSGIYAFIGRSTTASFVDNNITPTAGDTPPTGLDPFVGAGNYPGAVGYYQQRKVYGGTINKPQTSWFSRTGVFNNYSYSTPVKDDDAITWTMASLEVDRILHYLPLRQLVTFTNGSEWSIQGGSSGFTSKTINGDPQSYNGSGYVRPLVLNDTALYLQNNSRTVSSLNYTLEADGLSSDDLTIWSTHLFRDYGIKDWAYQKRPDSIVWAVREDGKLIALTYLRKQDVVAWHWHDTDGIVKSVVTVPEGSDDVLYLVVMRVIGGAENHHIERLQTRNIPLIPRSETRDVAMGFFVDCGLTYDGRLYMSNATLTTASTDAGDVPWQYGKPLTLTISGTDFFEASDQDTMLILSDANGETVTVKVTALPTDHIAYVQPQSLVPASLRGVPANSWARAKKNFAGLGHLEGKEVAILADGNVEPRQVVTGGSVTITSESGVVHIGLPYVSDLETLRINVAGQETLNDKYKTVTSVSLVLDETRGAFAGKSLDHLYELKQREFEDYNQPVNLLTAVERISITNDWEGQGEVFIRQEDPLPITILGIIPELTVAGKK